MRTVVVPEGYNMFDIAAAIEAAGLGSKEDFLAEATHDTALIRAVDPQAKSLEGYLFPDTYAFSRTMTMREMAAAMVRRFQKEAQGLGLQRDTHRLVTLASIVEKETAAPGSAPRWPAFTPTGWLRTWLWRPIPTVVYAAMLKGNYRGAIYQSDLQSDSPYNTYKFAGLPPGPIANPGAASLQAAMQPAQDRVPVLRRRRRWQRTPPLLRQLRAARAQRDRLSQGREGALMQLPPALRRAVEQELEGCDRPAARGAARLSECYRQGGGTGRPTRLSTLSRALATTNSAPPILPCVARNLCRRRGRAQLDARELREEVGSPCSISAAVPEPRCGRPCKSSPHLRRRPPSNAIRS